MDYRLLGRSSTILAQTTASAKKAREMLPKAEAAPARQPPQTHRQPLPVHGHGDDGGFAEDALSGRPRQQQADPGVLDLRAGQVQHHRQAGAGRGRHHGQLAPPGVAPGPAEKAQNNGGDVDEDPVSHQDSSRVLLHFRLHLRTCRK